MNDTTHYCTVFTMGLLRLMYVCEFHSPANTVLSCSAYTRLKKNGRKTPALGAVRLL